LRVLKIKTFGDFFMTTLNQDAMVVDSTMADAFGGSAPTTEAGLEKEAGQTGFFVYSTEDYSLYLKDAGGSWVLHATITAADNQNITYPWGDNTAAFFVCANLDAQIRVFRKTGSILYDSTPENPNDSADALLQSSGDSATLQTAYSFPAADGTTGQVLVTDGAGQLSFADQSGGGGDHAASNFTFDASLIPDTNAAYDLGSAEYKVRHLFLSDNSIKFESGDLNVVGGELAWNGEAISSGGSSGPKVVIIGMSADWGFNTTTVNEKQTVPFDQVDQNSFGSAVFDTATNTFTAPEDGFYYLNLSLYQSGIDNLETTQYQVKIEATGKIYGAAHMQHYPESELGAYAHTHKLDKVVYLTAGDQIWVSIKNVGTADSTTISAFDHVTYLSVNKL
jgi:hypothetical protein